MTARIVKFSLIFLVLFFSNAPAAHAQTSAFNFQGFLNDGGAPANGGYDLRFRLFDALTGGGQIGTAVERPNTALVNGVFSTVLDFGTSAFIGGEPRYLEISLRPAGSPNSYIVLGARQPILSAPYAIRAFNSAFAGVAASADTATTAQNSTNLGGTAAAEFVRRNAVNTGDLKMSGNLEIGGGNAAITANGNAVQSLAANGFVKAMLVFEGGNITRCYNGVTNSSTGNCNFSVSVVGFGIVRINFGFTANNRFVSITPEYAPIGASNNNVGANYRFFNSTTVEVFTFEANSSDTREARFTLVMF